MEQVWIQGAHDVAPHLKIRWIKGQKKELAGTVRWVAVIFLSLADNPQETFGITPLEAMAAGLPCVVSDWDGYRDSVVEPGEPEEATGFRITTRMIEGPGQVEAEGLLRETLNYELAVGRIAKGIAVDPVEPHNRLELLLSTPAMQKALGEAGQRQVNRLYRWEVVMQQWSELLDHLQSRRASAELAKETSAAGSLPPWLPTTSNAFGNFATEMLSEDWNTKAPPTQQQEGLLHRGVMQSWDHSLLQERGARRQGWWFKQALTEI